MRGRVRSGAAYAAVLVLLVGACGGDDGSAAPDREPADETVVEPSVADPGDADPGSADPGEAPSSDGVGTTAACDRVTPDELSAAFGATFSDGREITEGQCIFDSDGAPQVLIAVYSSSIGPSVCDVLPPSLERVEIAGHPGFWDEAGAQARVCPPGGSIAAILYGGGGDNSVHRDALIDLVDLATTR